jgi:hypothetical protein
MANDRKPDIADLLQLTESSTKPASGEGASESDDHRTEVAKEGLPVAGWDPSGTDAATAATQGDSGSADQQYESDLHSAVLATDAIACELEQTLTGLVNSTDLFEVPAMDFGDSDVV